jgi:hypothetical protein
MPGEVDHYHSSLWSCCSSWYYFFNWRGWLNIGGGVGHYQRKYGLTIDNCGSLDMVLADGSFVTVNANQNAVCPGRFRTVKFWNCYVKFQTHDVKTVFGGPTLWPIEKQRNYQVVSNFIHDAPDDLNILLSTMV